MKETFFKQNDELGSVASAPHGIRRNTRMLSTGIDAGTHTVGEFNNSVGKLAAAVERTQKLLDRF